MQPMQSFLMRRGGALWRVFTLLCVIAVVTCGIVDLAVSGGRNRVQYTIGTACLFIFPFLSILDLLSPVHGWARGIGYPIAAASMLYIAGVYALIRHVHWNGWTRASLIVLGAGVLSFACNSIVDRYLTIQIHWSTAINLVSIIAAAAILYIIGKTRRHRRQA